MINIAPAQCADVNAAKPRQVADVLLCEAFTVDDVGPWSGSPHDVSLATLLVAVLLPG